MKIQKTTLLAVLALGFAACATPTANTNAPELAASDQGAPRDVGTRATWMTPKFNAAAFQNIEEIFPSRRVAAATGQVAPLIASGRSFAPRYEFNGKTLGADDFIASNYVSGLLILRGDKVLYERYALGADPATRFISFSMGKSVVSTLVGEAVADGKIASINDMVSKYLPDVAGGAYEKATIRNVLEMSSGTSFDESQATADSDLARFIGVLARNQGGLYDFAKSFKAVREPGVKFNYASADTEVLGALLAKATGEPLANYLSRKVWQPMGAEADARWILDAPGSAGREAAAGGISARLRDYGRFGLMFLHNGKINGKQVVPANWVKVATSPQSPHTQIGVLGTNSVRGYGYQWWLPPGEDGVYMAVGIHGQFIFVDQKRDLVIVKTAAWPTPGGSRALVDETLAFHAGVAAQIDRGEGG